MTATPIPRSLALSLYGDLDVTELRELPAGRQPIITARVHAGKRAGLPRAGCVREWLEHGRQAYVVCALVEGSETVQARAAEELHAELVERARAAQRGPRCTGSQKAGREAPRRCAPSRPRETHVLVATTVIEVGIDVPNATAIVIEDADRFGLSQLHQLRGRVGRGSDQSYCFLFESPEPTELGAAPPRRALRARERLRPGRARPAHARRGRARRACARSGAPTCATRASPASGGWSARARADARLLERRGPRRPGARPGRRASASAGSSSGSGGREDRRRRASAGGVLAHAAGPAVRPTTGPRARGAVRRLGRRRRRRRARPLRRFSGALGFEALSRGAATCLFADTTPRRARLRARQRRRRSASRRAPRCGGADFRRVLRDEAAARPPLRLGAPGSAV